MSMLDQPCQTCKWWKQVKDFRGECHWPIPPLPRVAQLVSNVAWGHIAGCPVHEIKT